MKKGFAIFAAMAISIGLGAKPAAATVITKTVDFTATDLTQIFGPPSVPPVTSFVGSFTITFDTMMNYDNSLNGITLNNLNVPFLPPMAFSYSSSNSALIVGGAISGVNTVTSATNDFALVIAGFGDTAVQPVGVIAGFCRQATACFNSRNVSLSISGTPAVVPEAASWAMLLLGVGAVGAAMRRKHRRILRYDFA
ncbi:MAG TPA: PEPxxWA-CTERM sorting domain-containing protein [Novosphingobium sp.]